MMAPRMGVTGEKALARLFGSPAVLAHTIAEPLEEEVEASGALMA